MKFKLPFQDEAQEASNTATQVAKMVTKIPAVNKWAVSGTPIKNSFSDLKVFLFFLFNS